MQKILLLLVIVTSLPALAQNKLLLARATAASAAIEAKVIEWRRDFHANPELGNRETRTAGIVAEYLKSLGIKVIEHVGKTGVVGILKGALPGPVIALRADMDGLPIVERTPVPFASKAKTIYNGSEAGVMHACGHDAHTAILMGVANILSGIKKDLKGTVKFIFQPAEEGAPSGEEGGALLMVREGVMDNPKVDVVFGLHVDAALEVGKIGYRPAGFMASASDMKITIKGKGAHGASPWMGTDPIVTAAQIINSLQTIISRNLNLTENAAVISIGAIQGGNRFNIIPESVEMQGTVRTFTDADEKMIFRRINEVVMNVAEANGATAEVLLPYTVHYPVTFNDTALVRKMLPSLQASAGPGNCRLVAARTGAEDFSYYQQKAPGFFFNLGARPVNSPATSHHTADFYLDESSFKIGMDALTAMVLDYMNFKQ